MLALAATPTTIPAAEALPSGLDAASAITRSLEAGATLAPEGRVLTPLPLRSAIDQALRQNFGIVIQRFDPSIAADNVEIERAAFDPRLTVGAGIDKSFSASASSLLSGASRPTEENQTYSAGISQKVQSGATLGLESRMNRTDSNSAFSLINPDYAGEVGLTARQPLLRGAGPTVNLAPIAIARAAYRQSKLELRRQVVDTIAEAEIAYWNLAAAHALRDLRDTSVRSAEALLEENRERERLGLATRADVLAAEAALASRREDLILARQAIEDAEDRLRALLGTLTFSPATGIGVAPLTGDIGPVRDFHAVVRDALAADLETQIQTEVIEQRRLEHVVADDTTQPNLDVVAGGFSTGRDRGGLTALGDTYSRDGYRWNAGVELSMPWGFREEEARARRAVKNLERANVRLAQVQQDLMLRVRQSWRAVVAGRERRVTTRSSVLVNQEAFERERARFQAGASTFRAVLEAERDFDLARIRDLESALDLMRAGVRLGRIDGTLLTRHGFTWADAEREGPRHPGWPGELDPQKPAVSPAPPSPDAARVLPSTPSTQP